MYELIRGIPQFGWIKITSSGEAITKVCFLADGISERDNPDDQCREAWRQIEEWCHGKRQKFYLPLAPEATTELSKWLDALSQVPYGTTETYSDLAERWGNAEASIAAGNQCARNPLQIIIPCHRIINKGGGLGYYSGIEGLDIGDPRNLALKQALIDHEAANK